MVQVKDGLHGTVVLTITDSHGMVVMCETVRDTEADEIISRILPTIR